MTINKNWTYSSDGGYAAKQKQKEYVPKSVAKKASLMLREQERQRLIEAAKRLDAQTRGAAAPENSGFSMVNSRQTFPEVIAANRNAGAGNVQSGSAAPRNVRDVLDQQESTWRSGSFNGVIDPRAKNEFLNNIGAGSSAPNPAPKPAEKPEEEKKPQVFLSDAQKTRYGLLSNMGEIAGEKVDVEPIREWFRESKNREYKPTPREEFLYNRNKDMGDIAGGDFYDYFIKFKNPSMVNYTPPPYMKRKIQIGEGIFHGIQNGEKQLNITDTGDLVYDLSYAMFNQARGTAANTISKFLNQEADLIETYSKKIGLDLKPELLDWARSMENNSTILSLSEKQYSSADYKQQKIKNALNNCINKKLKEDVGFLSGIFELNIDFDIVKNANDVIDSISSKAEFGSFFAIALYMRTSVNKYEELRGEGMSVFDAYVNSHISGSIRALTEIAGDNVKLPVNLFGAVNTFLQDGLDVVTNRKDEIDWEEVCKELTYGVTISATIDYPELFQRLVKKFDK